METNNVYKQPIEKPSRLIHIISNDWFGLGLLGAIIALCFGILFKITQ
jgi:hypothetical protein